METIRPRGPAVRPAGAWAGYAAACWAFVFGAIHLVWATGWYVLLPLEEAKWSFARHWFWIYDLVIAGLLTIAGFVALALVRPWGRRVPRWLLLGLAWSGTALLVLRGGGAAIEWLIFVPIGKHRPGPMDLYDVWFCLGAVLFALALRRFRRGERTG